MSTSLPLSDEDSSQVVVIPQQTANSLANSDPKPWLFKPGQSGNPNGRPHSAPFSDYLRTELESGKAEVLGRRLVEIAEKEKPRIALQAIDMIADRVEGKPLQQVRVEQAVDARSLGMIAAICEKFLGPEPEYCDAEDVTPQQDATVG